MKFSDINIDFYNSFRFWFYKQGFSDNYFGSVIKVVKQVYIEAKLVDKLHSFDDISRKDFITVNAESDNIYLTEDELQKIYNLEITPELVRKNFPTLTLKEGAQQKYEKSTGSAR